jgi:hypothetical protein
MSTKVEAGTAPDSMMNRQLPATAALKSRSLPRPLDVRILFNDATAWSATFFGAFVLFT